MAKIKIKRHIFNESEGTVTPTDGIKKCKTFNPKKFIYKLSTVGNIKLGRIMSFSKLMGNYVYKRLKGVLKDIKGTCGNCAVCMKECYVRASYRYPSVIQSQAQNTWGMRNDIDKVEQDYARQLRRSKIPTVRINQSGELETMEELLMWCRLAVGYPQKNFYLYTKNYPLVTKALKKGAVPTNFTILFSIWHDVGVAEYKRVKDLPNVKAFVYDDGQLSLTPDTYCMAYKNGKLDHDITCERCKKCYNNALKHKVIGCKAH